MHGPLNAKKYTLTPIYLVTSVHVTYEQLHSSLMMTFVYRNTLEL